MIIHAALFAASALLGVLLYKPRAQALQPAGPFAADNPPVDWNESNQTQRVGDIP